MSYQYSVLVAGSGETSRANVDALIEDHYHANGKNGLVIIAYTNRPASGHVWAAQAATALGLDVLVVCPDDNAMDNLGNNKVKSVDPLSKAVDIAKDRSEKPLAFILWSDDDPDSAEILAYCKQDGVTALDLRNGLVEIQPSEDLTPSPKVEIPVEEQTPSPKADVVPAKPAREEPEDDEDESEDDDEDGDEDDLADVFYEGLYAFAELVADLVMERIKGDKK